MNTHTVDQFTEHHLEMARPWIGDPTRTPDEIDTFMRRIRGETGREVELVRSSVVVLHTAAQETLLLQRRLDDRSYPGMYTLPGGKRELIDTSPLATAQRELYEETGLVVPRSREIGTVYALLSRRLRIYEITGFLATLRQKSRPPVRLSEENIKELFIDPRTALARHHAGRLPLAGAATRHLLTGVLK